MCFTDEWIADGQDGVICDRHVDTYTSYLATVDSIYLYFHEICCVSKDMAN